MECICELLNSIGHTLDSRPAGKESIKQVCGRLLDLKQRKDKKGKGVYPMRVQFMIQDLLDTKNAGWMKKVFKATAKTKDLVGLCIRSGSGVRAGLKVVGRHPAGF